MQNECLYKPVLLFYMGAASGREEGCFGIYTLALVNATVVLASDIFHSYLIPFYPAEMYACSK